VFSAPNVAFTLDEYVICLGTSLSINNLSTGAAAYSWNFSNGEQGVGFEPPYVYPTSGTFQIQLVGYSPVFACPDTAFRTVTIQPLPLIDVVADPTSGCLPLFVQFTNSTLFSTSSEWDFGNTLSSTQYSPSTVYSSDGTYIAKLTAHNYNFAANLDCPANTEIPITVFPKPFSGFSTSESQVCGPPASTTVQNQSTGAFAYLWTWDNLQSLQENPAIVFADTGLHLITLVASNEYACSDTSTAFFDVVGQPNANLRIEPPNGCAPLAVDFEALSQYGDAWEWDFGDGFSASGNPTTQHVYPTAGAYQVTLRVSNENACFADTVINSAVIVYPNVVADFSMTPDIISSSYPLVSFTNKSIGASSYEFFPGDGSSYPGFISQHIYDINDESEYTVTLVANNSYNCPDTISYDITVAPTPSIYIPNSFTPNGDGRNDDFGPFLLEVPVIYDFMIFDRWGHLVFETFDKDVKWDGTMFNNGKKPIKQDVYVYKIVVAFEPEEVQQIHGNVTVIY
jgi:gliding motility-associated-like protein